MSDDVMTPDRLISGMASSLVPEKAGTTKATILFDLSGEDGGKWWIKIAEGKAESGSGEVERPTLTLTAQAADYVKVGTGQLDPTAAFMQGKLKIKGDMGLAMKMRSMFNFPAK